MERDKLIITAISSAIGGALLGILFAPEQGAKTRKNLADKSGEYFKEIKNSKDSLLKKTKETIRKTNKDIENYQEWTKQELYDHAKDLQIDGYSQMNKSELIQALDNQ